MWRRIFAGVVVGGCGFQAGGAAGDAGVTLDGSAPDAAPGDAAIDAGGAGGDCWPRWLARDLAFADPVEIEELSTGGNERDPWISADRLRMYFARTPPGGLADIELATRESATAAFGLAKPVVDLNTNAEDSRASLTQDERTLVLASDRDDNDGTANELDVYVITRAQRTDELGSPDQAGLASVNTFASRRFDPFLSTDGLRLYLAPDAGPSGRQQIFVATRSDRSLPFSTPAAVGGINAMNASTADPALSPDERVIVYSAFQAGQDIDLWYATRSGAGDDFEAPMRIPVVNSGAPDGDPMLSADGCTLYFASTRDGGDYDLYAARVDR